MKRVPLYFECTPLSRRRAKIPDVLVTPSRSPRRPVQRPILKSYTYAPCLRLVAQMQQSLSPSSWHQPQAGSVRSPTRQTKRPHPSSLLANPSLPVPAIHRPGSPPLGLQAPPIPPLLPQANSLQHTCMAVPNPLLGRSPVIHPTSLLTSPTSCLTLPHIMPCFLVRRYLQTHSTPFSNPSICQILQHATAIPCVAGPCTLF